MIRRIVASAAMGTRTLRNWLVAAGLAGALWLLAKALLPEPGSAAPLLPQPLRSPALTRVMTENQAAYHREHEKPARSGPLKGLAPAIITGPAALFGTFISTFRASRRAEQEA